ncbi:MAG: asparagine synthase (glutamine-hydrolyzing) [Deltaproteobacteria bacterium]|nr:asparagine synthase (glutamine-hydrolyzing) [Deltaproteobacteria bacterium]
MCGIVGIVYSDNSRKVTEVEVTSMRDLLVHRGPDDQGFFVDENVGIGHRRLSIIDLNTGHQPMTNEDESLWIVFNGEIYNFQELRENLIQRGHVFRTRSDTEVILHLYKERGENCPVELNGIFAFVIWDKRNRSLFLARDHMGIKPLYYAMTMEAFLFSSEIKSIVRSGHIEARCNEEVIPEYFVFRHVSGENTLFKGVKSLLPGHSMVLKDGAIRMNEYWSPFPKEAEKNISFETAAEELSWLIKDSVKKQMISDVPLGTFCSGGVDSSLVTAVATRLMNKPINTFSVGFYEDGYDETSYAQLVSKQYGTNHHEVKVSNQEFADLLPQMIWHNDEPLNFANSIQIYAISKLAKEHVTVVLTGEGADELFGGYPRYLLPRVSGWFRTIPSFLRNGILRGGGLLEDHRLEKIGRFSNYSLDEAILYNSSFLDKDFIQEVLPSCSFNGFPYRQDNLLKGKSLSMGSINRLSLLDQQNYLVSILMRQDKMSMAASIESRVPLLDYRIVEFANRLPSSYKINRFRTKFIIKKVAESYLPGTIINRNKSGFGVPLAQWFREQKGMGSLLEEISVEFKKEDLIKKDRFIKFVSEHKTGKVDHSELLWTSLNFYLWRKVFSV